MSVGVVEQYPGEQVRPSGQPTREYVGGGYRGRILRGSYATVGSAALDAESCGGPELWEMMATDPYIAASTRVIIAGILADGVIPASALCDDDGATEAEKKKADDICRFVCSAQRRMKLPLMGSLRQIIRCAAVHGTGMAETVMEDITSGPYKGKRGLARVKPKAIDTWAFRVDHADNVLGIEAYSSALPGDATVPRLLPRNKFAILAWDQQDGCPAGRSAYREAEPAWSMRVQSFPLFWDCMDLWGNPFIVGECGPNQESEPERDDDGEIIPGGGVVEPVDQMFGAICRLATGKAIAVNSGGKVYLLQPEGDGEIFTTGLDLLAREIVTAIIGSARVIMEAQQSSKKDGEVNQDLFGIILRMWKTLVRDMIRRDIYMPLVAENFGDADAEEFTPIASMGDTEHQDFSRNSGGIARLFQAGALDERDRPFVCRFLFGGRYDPPMGPPEPVAKPSQPVQEPQSGANSGNPPSSQPGRAA